MIIYLYDTYNLTNYSSYMYHIDILSYIYHINLSLTVVHIYIYLYDLNSKYLPIFMCVYVSICNLYIYLSINLCIYLSIYPSMCLSIYLSIYCKQCPERTISRAELSLSQIQFLVSQ